MVPQVKTGVPYDVTGPRTKFVHDLRVITKGNPSYDSCPGFFVPVQYNKRSRSVSSTLQVNALAHTITVRALKHIGMELETSQRKFDSDSYIQSLVMEAEHNLNKVKMKHVEYKKIFSIKKSTHR